MSSLARCPSCSALIEFGYRPPSMPNALTSRAFSLAVCIVALLCAACTSAVRLSSEDALAQQIDWRKVTAVGTVGAASLSSGLGYAAAQAEAVETSQQEAGPTQASELAGTGLDRYDAIESMLAAGFATQGLEIELPLIEKLMADVARRHTAEAHLVSDVNSGLESGPLHAVHAPSTRLTLFQPKGKDLPFQLHAIEGPDGHRYAVVARLLPPLTRKVKKESREAQERMVQNFLSSMEPASVGGGPFLHIFAESHSADMYARDLETTNDGGPEVLVMLEPFSATLREYLDQYEVSLPKRLSLFYSVLAGLDELHRAGVAHAPLAGLDSVLITGNLQAESSTSAVLCPSLLLADPEARDPERDNLQELMTLGYLLSRLLKAPTGCHSRSLQPLEDINLMLQKGEIKHTSGSGSGLVVFLFQAAVEESVRRAFQDHATGSCQLGDAEAWEELRRSTSSGGSLGRGAEAAPLVDKVHAALSSAARHA